ncbi:hypothetical protein ColTof4_10854 [Colletotrichum tofieldiae]|nr:hypothetical protein ColTof3_06971 [Colletotrichum tofieldiae]GKT78431.1 hypothetical protein ColTof4_10854 [Colletotrichum tofieldiae]
MGVARGFLCYGGVVVVVVVVDVEGSRKQSTEATIDADSQDGTFSVARDGKGRAKVLKKIKKQKYNMQK